MAQLGFRKPKNGTTQGHRLEPLYLKIGTNGAGVKPQMRVMYDVDGATVKADDGTGKDIGIVDFSDTLDQFKPATMTTAFNVGDHVAVFPDDGRTLVVLASGNNVTINTPLKPVAGGKHAIGIEGTDKIRGYAMESVNATAGDAFVWMYQQKV